MQTPRRLKLSFLALLAAGFVLQSTGCTAIKTPRDFVPEVSIFPTNDAKYRRMDGQQLQPSQSAESYQKIRQAKNQNAIVLQVYGDSEPIRVLPLPAEGKSVFVSELFRQTGLQKKMTGAMHATLYRPSPDSLNGVRMEIKMDESGDQVVPSCDYALRPGDRIEIVKDESSGLQHLVNFALRR